LIEIVQQLGEYINDEDPILRGKAVSFLTSVIKSLPPRYLSRQQIQVLTTFFRDRIEDGGAVAGLDTLQRLDRFTKELAAETAQSYVLSFAAPNFGSIADIDLGFSPTSRTCSHGLSRSGSRSISY
jgi:DNA repair/transcription protein MET18/MMS19